MSTIEAIVTKRTSEEVHNEGIVFPTNVICVTVLVALLASEAAVVVKDVVNTEIVIPILIEIF